MSLPKVNKPTEEEFDAVELELAPPQSSVLAVDGESNGTKDASDDGESAGSVIYGSAEENAVVKNTQHECWTKKAITSLTNKMCGATAAVSLIVVAAVGAVIGSNDANKSNIQAQRSDTIMSVAAKGGKDSYQFPTSDNFAGVYELCFQSRIFTHRLQTNKSLYLCRNGLQTSDTTSRRHLEFPVDEGEQDGIFDDSFYKITISAIDQFTQYQAEINMEMGAKVHDWNFQGFANGNHLVMQSFGVNNGHFINHTPDDMTCTLHDEYAGILSCTQMTQEYCGEDDLNEECAGVPQVNGLRRIRFIPCWPKMFRIALYHLLASALVILLIQICVRCLQGVWLSSVNETWRPSTLI